MTKEDERTDNGGLVPSEAEEYRGEDRYSVRSISEDASSGDVKKDEGKKTGETDDAAPPSGERLTREELESKYRNDPRFNMLFDHEVKRKKKKTSHYVKVGGIRLTPKRIFVLCGFLLVFLICMFSSFFYALKDIGKYRNYNHARAVFESGDYEKAKELFVKVIGDDPNKEGAIKAMAQIYHYYGDWSNEAFFRQRLVRLNPLSEEYYRDFLNAAFRARNFGTIYSHLNLKVMENPELPPEEGALYVISAMHSEHVSNGKAFYADRIKSDRKYFSSTESGRYVELLLNASDIDRDKARKIISSLPDIKDKQVRFETISTLLYFFSKQSDRESDEQMEKLLKESAELNEFAGAPMLADYYFSHYRFEDSLKTCEEFLKTKINAFILVLYGESCLLSGHPELIPPLAAKVRNLRGRQSIIIASYFDAMQAFGEGDEVRLRSAMLESESTIMTPLSLLMRLHLSILSDSPKEILFLLDKIMKDAPFLDFQQRARTLALRYLLKQADLSFASDPDRLSSCAEIAAMIQTPDDDVSFLKRIIVLDHFRKEILSEEELAESMNVFRGDPILLRIAAEYYLKRERPAHAMDCITEYNSLEYAEGQDSMTILHILALNQLGRKDEAEKEFRILIEKNEDKQLLFFYYEFCAENKLYDSLKSLLTWIESLPKDSPNRAALPFIRAEILLSEGKQDQALSLFEKSPSDDPQYIFHAAKRLAEAGRNDAALARYQSIQNTYPDKAEINMNLSELYAEKGDAKNALACARIAWEADRNDLQARYVYGKRLYDSGEYAEAVTVLNFPQYKAYFPKEMLDLWSKAIHEQIKADFDAGRYTPALENVKYLLIYFPDDEAGLDYVEMIQTIRRHEKSGDGK